MYPQRGIHSENVAVLLPSSLAFILTFILNEHAYKGT